MFSWFSTPVEEPPASSFFSKIIEESPFVPVITCAVGLLTLAIGCRRCRRVHHEEPLPKHMPKAKAAAQKAFDLGPLHPSEEITCFPNSQHSLYQRRVQDNSRNGEPGTVAVSLVVQDGHGLRSYLEHDGTVKKTTPDQRKKVSLLVLNILDTEGLSKGLGEELCTSFPNLIKANFRSQELSSNFDKQLESFINAFPPTVTWNHKTEFPNDLRRL